jgi:hypothetical protein
MLMSELPLQWMNKKQSNPSQGGLEFLVHFGVPYGIENQYVAPDDRADAYDGAFTAVQIAHLFQQLQITGDKKTNLYPLVLQHYERQPEKSFDSPFYFGLKQTLDACGLGSFYEEFKKFIEQRQF